ncbi:Hypothetical_protein [Hexamita inflata]|uniref:Hypothetical_protein n=1 Tax=Hexamita inflata TaxID=28002 RepID=A0AA86UJX9_9EUKA|nr:Hypothetical protein HINF_LOCUS41941 [Hexamita inflata]
MFFMLLNEQIDNIFSFNALDACRTTDRDSNLEQIYIYDIFAFKYYDVIYLLRTFQNTTNALLTKILLQKNILWTFIVVLQAVSAEPSASIKPRFENIKYVLSQYWNGAVDNYQTITKIQLQKNTQIVYTDLKAHMTQNNTSRKGFVVS